MRKHEFARLSQTFKFQTEALRAHGYDKTGVALVCVELTQACYHCIASLLTSIVDLIGEWL